MYDFVSPALAVNVEPLSLASAYMMNEQGGSARWGMQPNGNVGSECRQETQRTGWLELKSDLKVALPLVS